MSTVSWTRSRPILVVVYAAVVAACAVLAFDGHAWSWWAVQVLTFPAGLVMQTFGWLFVLLLIGGEPGNDALVIALVVTVFTAVASAQFAFYLWLAHRVAQRCARRRGTESPLDPRSS